MAYDDLYNLHTGLIGPPQTGVPIPNGIGPGSISNLGGNDFLQGVLQLLNGTPSAVGGSGTSGGVGAGLSGGGSAAAVRALMALVSRILSSQGMSFDPFGGF